MISDRVRAIGLFKKLYSMAGASVMEVKEEGASGENSGGRSDGPTLLRKERL